MIRRGERTPPRHWQAFLAAAVTAAALTTLAITPSSIQAKVGSSVSLQATGTDAYGNPVAVNPAWSVTPNLGTLSPATGSRTTFTATSAGTGTTAATTNGHTATATLTVTRRHH